MSLIFTKVSLKVKLRGYPFGNNYESRLLKIIQRLTKDSVFQIQVQNHIGTNFLAQRAGKWC